MEFLSSVLCSDLPTGLLGPKGLCPHFSGIPSDSIQGPALCTPMRGKGGWRREVEGIREL